MSEISPAPNPADTSGAASRMLPVAVLGAGPIGLAAAAELVGRDQQVIVLEAGDRPAAGVESWGHVRLFSPWSELTSPAGTALLQPSGWQHPAADRYPTGAEWVTDYLAPLAAVLGDRIRLGNRVVGVARQDRDLVVDSGRAEQAFVVYVEDSSGTVSRILARSVIDATGTLARPNPLGSEGYPVPGERAAADRIVYGMPDPATDEDRYAGRATAVVGSGASALTSLIALTSEPLHRQGSRVVWVLRRGTVGDSYGGGEADELPARGALGTRVREAVEEGLIDVVTGFRTLAVDTDSNGVTLVGSDGRRIDGLDQVVCVTGFRPDLSFLSEVRLELDNRLQAPVQLAAEIDPNYHSCGSVRPHGHRALAQPEPGLYLAGMKSYGRAPSFLAMTGFEQVRSIAAALAGDGAAADDVQLVLPDSGVCGGAGLFDDDTTVGGCCGTTAATPEFVELTGLVTATGAPVVAAERTTN
ncbi:FAD-dependent oxidoreductase [Microlunatus soli]|uniref:Pyridine nucleotide-disulphide oxidoreductase n=1 Tax=Microlunatus soli TaxID=630515 RepID=A0A1H1QQH7_9ACTN|nr:FAD-dependent oxidoreductase [Microlunatus soli]SDS25730.1 Pyridine nucleotide-disulphide oxidoreductase [Microlunatus soli]